jgi:hypothetical protein
MRRDWTQSETGTPTKVTIELFLPPPRLVMRRLVCVGVIADYRYDVLVLLSNVVDDQKGLPADGWGR